MEAKPKRGVSDLLTAQGLEATLHVFPRDVGLDLFDPHEILFVERAQAIEARLELFDVLFDLRLLHYDLPPRSYIGEMGVTRTLS